MNAATPKRGHATRSNQSGTFGLGGGRLASGARDRRSWIERIHRVRRTVGGILWTSGAQRRNAQGAGHGTDGTGQTRAAPEVTLACQGSGAGSVGIVTRNQEPGSAVPRLKPGAGPKRLAAIVTGCRERART